MNVVLVHALVAFMAGLLALGVAVHAWRTRSLPLASLAAWLALLALNGAMPVAVLSVPGLRWPPAALQLAALINALAGALLITYVAQRAHLRLRYFLPFLALAVLVFGLGVGAEGGRAVNTLVNQAAGLEFMLTLCAWWVWWRATPAAERWRWPVPPVIGVLLAVSTLQLSQLVIIFHLLPLSWLLHINFSVIGAWLLLALLLAVAQSPMLRTLAPALAPVADSGDQALFARIEQAMREQRPWTEPDLEVGDLAERLGASPNAVSRALSRAGTTTFHDFVNAHRVREAERLLLDPAEARYKVEALGRQAGFRSRSTFFKVFRNHTGVTPAEYRRRHSSGKDAVTSP